MAERGGERGGFSHGFGRGGRGDRGGRRGGRRGPRQDEEKWVPVSKLGRPVMDGKFSRTEEIYLHSLPVKEHQIVEKLCPVLKDEVMKITPVQKQTPCAAGIVMAAMEGVGGGADVGDAEFEAKKAPVMAFRLYGEEL